MKLNKKLFSLFALATLGLTSAMAETTMCFKENHKNFATIEQVKLDGGLCNSTKTAADMKKDGWTVDDIKISGSNYIYIFKKQTTLTTINMAELERNIIARLEDKKKEDLARAKRELRAQMTQNGKETYLNTCQKCHGEKGELTPYNSARPLNSLNIDDFKLAIRDYTIGTYDRGYAMIMKPYANTMTTQKVKEVYIYLQSLNSKDKEKEVQK